MHVIVAAQSAWDALSEAAKLVSNVNQTAYGFGYSGCRLETAHRFLPDQGGWWYYWRLPISTPTTRTSGRSSAALATTTPVPPSYAKRTNADVIEINRRAKTLFGPDSRHCHTTLYGCMRGRGRWDLHGGPDRSL